MRCRYCGRPLPTLSFACPTCRTKRLIWYVLMAAALAAAAVLTVYFLESWEGHAH